MFEEAPRPSESVWASPGDLDDQLARYFASDPKILADPYPMYRALRAQGPLHQTTSMAVVSRHKDVKAVALDSEHFPSDYISRGSRMQRVRAQFSADDRALFDEYIGYEAYVLTRTAGDNHHRLRGFAQGGFTPRRIATLDQRVQSYAAELLPKSPSTEPLDFTKFATQLPLLVMMDLLDFPLADAELVRDWSARIGNYKGEFDPPRLRAAHSAVGEFTEYIDRVLDQHRQGTRTSELVAGMVDAHTADRLSSVELAVICASLLLAGHVTSSHLIGNGLLELLSAPEQWRLLCADPDLASSAVEELLRYVSPVQWTGRVAAPGATVDSVDIPEGTTVFMLNGSANRDETVFPDADRLDIRRPAKKDHLAFGIALHFCLGAPLARLEGETVFRTIATRFPGTRLAVDRTELTWGGNSAFRGPKELPIVLAR
jgi:cytochrome P450